MAIKIKLGNRPKTFNKTVSFPMLEGGEDGCIGVTFRYRTRDEYAAYIDARIAAAKEADGVVAAVLKGGGEPEEFSLVKQLEKSADASVGFILDNVESWNLDVPFDREAVTQLNMELPGAVSAIIESYRLAINEGRLGN